MDTETLVTVSEPWSY